MELAKEKGLQGQGLRLQSSVALFVFKILCCAAGPPFRPTWYHTVAAHIPWGTARGRL